jgi:xanthine dehydrogenase accessory factor
MMMTVNSHWFDAVQQLSAVGQAYVLVTIVAVRGSAPRNSGAKMVVSHSATFDSIGGGHLEHQATKIALELLAKGQQIQRLENFPLGPKLGQCCGGITSLLFECFECARANIMLFGAGHVGHAVALILATLPIKLNWVDQRQDLFNPRQENNISYIVSDSPSDEVATMPPQSYYLVLTHNHQLDYDICRAILKRQDFKYLGLIGSETKWKRFRQRFFHRGITQAQVERISCPIGLADVPGKLPMEVAVAIVGEIIGLYQSENSLVSNKQGVDWPALKALANGGTLISSERVSCKREDISNE